MTAPSWIYPIYFLDVAVVSGRCKSGTTPARTCEWHKLNKPHGNVLVPGHLHKLGDFSVVEVLDDDSIQFDRLEV